MKLYLIYFRINEMALRAPLILLLMQPDERLELSKLEKKIWLFFFFQNPFFLFASLIYITYI